MCVRPRLCKTLTKIKKRPFENFIPKNSCGGSYVCCPPKYENTKAIKKTKCGIQNSGSSRNWPWLAIIRYGHTESAETRNLCSGSLISSKHILTSAMCVNTGPLSVVLGHSDAANGPEVFNVSKVNIHPEFDLETFSNNLAVVELSKEVKLSDSVLPICLPDSTVQQGLYTEAGWATFEAGDSTIVSRDVEAIDKNECQELLDQTNMEFVNFSLNPSLLCTMDRVQPETCVGDLGGPLVRRHPNTGQFEIAGVRTIPLMCGHYGGHFPEIYTDMRNFQGWIQAMVQQ
eukprot:GFUD01101393.1.p1 GENE.GFUD01101393.1~~GFUD01101393.1.p1  ORF type:complete len:287 (+),score=53.39 GFUD01101393.1:1-861(+)